MKTLWRVIHADFTFKTENRQQYDKLLAALLELEQDNACVGARITAVSGQPSQQEVEE